MGAQWKAKHKDLAANARGRVFGKLSKEIMMAARNGADPALNSRLRLVMEQAREVYLLADSSKIGRVALARSGKMEKVKTLITDRKIDREFHLADQYAGPLTISPIWLAERSWHFACSGVAIFHFAIGQQFLSASELFAPPSR